jgi:hypothetical protein
MKQKIVGEGDNYTSNYSFIKAATIKNLLIKYNFLHCLIISILIVSSCLFTRVQQYKTEAEFLATNSQTD